jgi:hypothetical protein
MRAFVEFELKQCLTPVTDAKQRAGLSNALQLRVQPFSFSTNYTIISRY